MAEESDDDEDATPPHVDDEPELIDMPPGSASTSDVQLFAVHRTAPDARRWTGVTLPENCHLHHISSSLCCLGRLSRMSGPRLCLHVLRVLTTSPRLPDRDRQKTSFLLLFHRCCCETRTQESKHEFQVSLECLEASGPRSVQVSLTRLEPTAIRRELWFACEGTGVSTGGRAHSSPFFKDRTKESTTCVQVFFQRMLGSVHDGQPTTIL